MRGSNVVCLFEEFVSRDNNTMAGKLVLDALKQDLNFLLEFSRKTNEGITAKVKDETWSNEQSVNSLVSVKEHLNLIAERREEVSALPIDSFPPQPPSPLPPNSCFASLRSAARRRWSS